MYTTIRKFLYEEVEALGKAGVNNYLNQGTKCQLNELLRVLKERIDPIFLKVKEMKEKIQDESDVLEITADAFHGAHLALGIMEYSLCHTHFSPYYRDNAARSAADLEQHMATLSTHCPNDNRELISQHHQLKALHAKVISTHANISLMQMIQNRWDTFIALKQAMNPDNAAISQAYRNLMGLINHLPNNGQLSAQLSDIFSYTNENILQTASTRMTQALENQLNNMEISLQETRMLMAPIKQTMDVYFNKYETIARQRIQEKRTALLEKNGELIQDLHRIRTWETTVRDTTIINVNFIPFMKWFQDTVHSLAVSQTKAIVAEIREVLIEPPFYACIVNRMVIKFLEMYGKEHIRQS